MPTRGRLEARRRCHDGRRAHRQGRRHRRSSLDGRSVDITVDILAKYQIRTERRFHIDALGFLGDQYIEVTPAEEAWQPTWRRCLTNGDTVMGESPFNMQEAVRSVSGLLDQARKPLQDLDQAITNVNHTVLADDTLTNFAGHHEQFGGRDRSAAVMAAASPRHARFQRAARSTSPSPISRTSPKARTTWPTNWTRPSRPTPAT